MDVMKGVLILIQFLTLARVGELRDVRNPSCGLALDVQNFVFLDRLCEDCYNIFRLDEVKQECQADCYDNDFFFVCLNVTLVSQEKAERAAQILSGITDPDYLDTDVLS